MICWELKANALIAGRERSSRSTEPNYPSCLENRRYNVRDDRPRSLAAFSVSLPQSTKISRIICPRLTYSN